MKPRLIAINNIMLAQINAFRTLYKFKTRQAALDFLFDTGLFHFINLRKPDDKYIIAFRDPFLARILSTTRHAEEIDIKPFLSTRNKIFLSDKFRHTDSAVELMRFYLGNSYSFSKIYSYVIYLGLVTTIEAGYFKPNIAVTFDLDKVSRKWGL